MVFIRWWTSCHGDSPAVITWPRYSALAHNRRSLNRDTGYDDDDNWANYLLKKIIRCGWKLGQRRFKHSKPVIEPVIKESQLTSLCLPLPAGQVASLTETCFMDWMLGSCAGHYRLWPLTSLLFHWERQSDCFISVMSPLFTQWQFSTPTVTLGLWSLYPQPAGSQFRCPPPYYGKASDGKLLCITVAAVCSEQDSGIQKLILWKKGICLAQFSRNCQ